MGGIENAIYDNLSKKGWKNQVFTVSGNFTAPITGLYFINGVAGGAAGRVGADSADRAGGGAGESVSMMPIYLSAGTVVSIAIGAGGTGDGGRGGNTTFGSYFLLQGGGWSTVAENYLGGGRSSANGTVIAESILSYPTWSYYRSPGAGAQYTSSMSQYYTDFQSGVKGGTYMWGGAGSKYAAGGAGNSGGAGLAGSLGSGGGSGTTAAGHGGNGYLEIMWQE